MRSRRAAVAPEDKVRWRSTIPYVLFHVAALGGAILAPPTAGDLVLLGTAYMARMFVVVTAYHRYFSHRSFSTSRAFQFVLGALGASSGQQGPLWWAWVHRNHHRYTDRPQDFHSPYQRGFLFAHVGWIFTPRVDKPDYATVADLARYPELRWLDRFWGVPLAALGGAFFLFGGVHGLVWGFLVSTVVLWQATYSINSLMHLVGRRRFPTPDTSRNSLALAILTLGEGWHNNHHYYPGSMWQGFYWWQVDFAGYVIKALSWVRLVWDVRSPPERVLELGRRWRTNPDLRLSVEELQARADRAGLPPPEPVATLRETGAAASP